MAPGNHEDDQTRPLIVLTKGTMVDQYCIIEKIGAGGKGEVYLAEDTELNRKVERILDRPFLKESSSSTSKETDVKSEHATSE